MAIEDGSKLEPGSSIRNWFIEMIEDDLREGVSHAAEMARYREYLATLGGKVISSMPLPEDTCAIAQAYNRLSKTASLQAVDPRRSIERTVINRYPLSEILDLNPALSDFWRSVAEEDIVSHTVYTQPPFEKPAGERSTIGKDGDIPIPNCLIELREDSTVRIYFLPPTGVVLPWPHCVAETTFTFESVPAVIDRAFRVYHNACKTRRRSLFFDVNPSHSNFKSGFQEKRIAIEYKIDQPNRMRSVMVETDS